MAAAASMTSMKLTASASLLHNNLAASPSGWFSIVHNSVNSGGSKIIMHANGGSKDGPETTQGMSIRYLHLGAQGCVLCVSSTNGTQMYTEDATTLLHYARSMDSTEHHKGSCVVQPFQHIVIGTSVGGLVSVDASQAGIYMPMSDNLPASAAAAVADVCYCTIANTVVSAHDDGELRVWTAPHQNGPYTNSVIVPPVGEAPVRIVSMGIHLVVAYGDGIIRLFDAMEHQAIAEITAHARCLTAMDIREEYGQVATVGEDTILNVWLIEPTRGQVSVQYSTPVTSKLLTGVTLTGTGAAISSYDSDELVHVTFP